ncbi:hypothetical protein [Lysinibacillus sp. LZ02]|uniref:hypothetical protein n=1 Tax=Lysinibacillus sp. LZ02 TaxID=3420668 RepID=UPI003D3608AD
MKLLKSEKGITLLETVVSLLLISIILISFFSFFVQSKKTNSSSESISEATYIAQKEMEQIYTLSKSSSLLNLSTTYLQGLEYTSVYPTGIGNTNNCTGTANTNQTVYSAIFAYERPIENYTSKVTISTLCNYTNAGNVLIEITDSNNNLKATVENIYIWQ